MKKLCVLMAGLLAAGAASASVIEYNFETAENISGETSNIVYTAADLNTFGAGVTVSDLELSDNTTASTDYGRIITLTGGDSVEAAVNDRAGNSISFTITIDDATIVDLTDITFDTSYYFWKNVNPDPSYGWDFYTIIGGVTNNYTSEGGYANTGSGYISTDEASGDISLTGLTGLTDTSVTFVWELEGNKNNTFDNATLGLDDIVLTGTVTAVPEPATLGMLAAAGLGILFLRRRLRA
jgi:hypothetical protein